MVDWESEVRTREDLLLARMRQLDQRVLAEAQAAKNLRNSRKANKACFDQQKRFRGEQQQLHVGDLVLLHNTKTRQSRSREIKLDDNWRGPYRIRGIDEDSTFLLIGGLDDTHLKPTIASKSSS